MGSALKSIETKVRAGRRLSVDDGVTLLRSVDLWTLGRLADLVRRRLHDTTTYYNINRHLNYSNLCALSCKFCSFYRKKGQEGEYEFSIDHIAAEARAAGEGGATEMHIVGGLHPYLPFSYYTDMCSAIRHPPAGEIVPAMLDGVAGFAESKVALNNLVGKLGQSAYEVEEHATYRGLVR